MAAGTLDTAAESIGAVFSAQRIGGTQAHAFQCLPEVATQRHWVTEFDQATECTFAIGRGRVDENTGHWPPAVPRLPRVDTLADARRSVATVEYDLAHESMSQGVQEY